MPRRKDPRIPDAVLNQLLAGADPKTVFDPNGLLDARAPICLRPIPICSRARAHAGVFRLSAAGVAACTHTTV